MFGGTLPDCRPDPSRSVPRETSTRISVKFMGSGEEYENKHPIRGERVRVRVRPNSDLAKALINEDRHGVRL